MSHRVLARTVLATVAVCAAAVVFTDRLVPPVFAQQPRPPQARGDATAAGDLHLLPVQGNVHMLVGPAGNTTIQIEPPTRPPRTPGFYTGTGYGVLLVDTQTADIADRMRAAIRTISPGNVRWVINTTLDPSHLGGNAAFAAPAAGARGAATQIVAQENMVLRLAEAEGESLPKGSMPTDGYVDLKEMWFNGESIQIFHVPSARTDGDSIVYFRRSDVISAGDIFTTTSYPVIDGPRGGSIQGYVDGLNRILDLAIPESNEEGGTRIVPGHGRLSDEADVVEYRNMVVIVRDRIQELAKQGKTLEQVKAAKPTLDYDFRYGAASGPWTTDMFIDAVYKEVSKAVAPPATRRKR